MSESGEISGIEEVYEEVEDPRQEKIEQAVKKLIQQEKKQKNPVNQQKSFQSITNSKDTGQMYLQGDNQVGTISVLQEVNIGLTKHINNICQDKTSKTPSQRGKQSDILYIDSEDNCSDIEILDTTQLSLHRQKSQVKQAVYIQSNKVLQNKNLQNIIKKDQDKGIAGSSAQQLQEQQLTSSTNLPLVTPIPRDSSYIGQFVQKQNNYDIQNTQKVFGVDIVPDDIYKNQNAQVQKLLRQPRYFDDTVNDEIVKRCFKCGEAGHLTRSCPKQKLFVCILCAQYGHQERTCPNKLCFKCGETGHVLRECRLAFSEIHKRRICLECGSRACECAGKGDYYRFENGCFKNYDKEDLRHIKCFICFRKGHFCCKELPQDNSQLSCYRCGSSKHSYTNCREAMEMTLQMERQQDNRNTMQHNVQQPRYGTFQNTNNHFYSQAPRFQGPPQYQPYRQHQPTADYGKIQQGSFHVHKRYRITH